MTMIPSVNKQFPILDEIESVVDRLNQLLKEADEQTLSIRFSQMNKKIKTKTGELVEGPPDPHLYITTLSHNTPK